MNTYSGNIGLIVANTVKVLLAWLDKHGIPYDELHVGKPWAGRGGFYVDDRAIRPSEFLEKTYEEILELIEPESARKAGA
jgi:capsule biosynthesis phosphatase